MAQQAFRFTQATDGTITIGSGGAIAGASTITATGAISGGSLTDGTLTIDGSGNITGAVGITASGAISGGSLTDGTATISSGAIAGATTITATGLLTALGADLTSGGITNAGAIAGATTITATGLVTSVGLDAGAGAITTTGTADLGATTVDSLDASSGGITNAGAIAGATTINASGAVTSGGLVSTGVVDLSGAASVTVGAYSLPIVDGTANYVLKTDGEGTVSWAADSGSSTPGASGDILLSDGAGGFSVDASFNIDTSNELLQIGAGGSVYGAFKSNTAAITTGSATTIDSFAGGTYAGAKYVITATDDVDGSAQTTEIVVAADGSGSSFVPFADVWTGSQLFTVSVTAAATPEVQVTRSGSNNLTVRFLRQTIAA